MDSKRASGGVDSDACELFLVPSAVVKSWRRDETLASIDRPLDNNLAAAANDVTRVVREAAAWALVIICHLFTSISFADPILIHSPTFVQFAIMIL